VWNLDTLRPRTYAELLGLANRHNTRYVKVVGYNNGVVHFGQQHPGKTVVSTVCLDRTVRTRPDVIKVDCGATIRDALDLLAPAGQELHVIPNYSYVCLGTAFFVPIHGSATAYSTVAQTIVKVLLYDPASDRFLLVRPGEPAFDDHVFNMAAGVVLLRLWLRVKAKTTCSVLRQEMDNPSGQQLLEALRDKTASNVEIRKSNAASRHVTLSRYFEGAPAPGSSAVEMPRDALGRLWDRLEENPITSFLMHLLTRRLAWHVELFFTAEEFASFWEMHRDLPLKKIQVRAIQRDGWPHSPFRTHDCVSVDLFLLRWQRRRFEKMLRRTFTAIRYNPGKHSQ
jgi:hypothetical protein